MAPRRSSHLVVLFSLAVLIALWVPSSAQSSSATGCLTTLVNLYPCLSFVNGTSAAPSSSCCSALGGVIQSNPQCLCSLIDGGSFPGVTINKTLALALPAACSLSTTSASQCNGQIFLIRIGIPAATATIIRRCERRI
ncbi:non-specific lipid-transfer protein [Genlisea aurea]|uniref:Non-specific lipid-transfer protein n=1 Tax=Genlisea aurea TaxID=192259 RepID=S8CDN7_9LAMI|nr:non-specific lipid-transfer protein [Genlisea aurea]